MRGSFSRPAVLAFLAFTIQRANSCIPQVQTPSNATSAEPPTDAPTAPSSTTETQTTEKTTKPVYGDCLTVDRNPGRVCVFPFQYENQQHHECLPFKGRYWCALTPVYDQYEWGYCDTEHCPPTAAKPTETPGLESGATTRTTGEANTTTTAAPLNWEAGSTIVEMIADEESFKCQIQFDFALEKGVLIKGAIGTCAGSSSTNMENKVDKFGRHSFSLKTTEGIELECEVGVAMLDSSSLSTEVLDSSLSCVATEADCVTIDGPVFPATCIFPFNYQGRRYQACTDRPGSTKLWCPTKVSDSEEASESDWGFCSKKCGYCGGSPITTRGDTDESCGYDCLLRADKDMLGHDKVPLLKPTIDVIKPVQQNYIGEIARQHQFNIGPQSMTISCPETKFYDPALQGLSSVQAECGPQKYRFTVSTKSGDILGKEFKNDQFGCDPCPKGMSYVEGLLKTTSIKSMGVFYNIGSLGQCNALCSDKVSCNSFEFSKYEKRCHLVEDIVTSSSISFKFKSITVCSKSNKEEIMCKLRTGGNPCDPNCPSPDFECKKKNEPCIWDIKRINVAGIDIGNTFWKGLGEALTALTANTNKCEYYEEYKEQPTTGVCCPKPTTDKYRNKACLFTNKARPPSEKVANVQCGYDRGYPGFCSDKLKCIYNKHFCFQHSDCSHLPGKTVCASYEEGLGNFCTRCNLNQRTPTNPCPQNYKCVRGECVTSVLCYGHWYIGGMSQHGDKPMLLMRFHNGDGHFHLQNSNPPILETANFPYKSGEKLLSNIARLNEWKPVIQACEDAVDKEGKYAWSTQAVNGKQPFFARKANIQRVVKFNYNDNVAIPPAGYWQK